jgi:hypothetical protein
VQEDINVRIKVHEDIQAFQIAKKIKNLLRSLTCHHYSTKNLSPLQHQKLDYSSMFDQLRAQETLTKLAAQSLLYLWMKEVPTKSLQPMNQPCLDVVARESSTE